MNHDVELFIGQVIMFIGVLMVYGFGIWAFFQWLGGQL